MNKTRKTAGKMTALLGAAMVAAGAAAAPTISITGAQQRYPWNNIVDVTYTLANAGENPDTYAVVLTTTINGAEVELSNGCEPSTNGTHTAICVLPSDLQATGLKVTGKIYEMAKCVPTVGNLDANNDYIIVDLENGGETFEAKLDYQALSNRRYKALDYMTKKMVLRKLPGEDYWLCIYPCTQGQWSRLNRAASTNDSVSVATYISWNAVYGTPLTTTIPAVTGTSGKYAIPTQPQWAKGARAGTTTAYHWGDNWDNGLGTLGQDGTVARFVPNAWGIYDMNGTVVEWSATGSMYNGRLFVGGAYQDGITAATARSSSSDGYGVGYNNGGIYSQGSTPYRQSSHYGFRLARVAK